MFIIILGLNLRTYKAVSANGHTCIYVWFLLNCKWRNMYNILEMRKGQSCLPPVYFVCLCVFSNTLHLLSMKFLCCMQTLEWRLQVLIQCVCFIGQNEFMWSASIFFIHFFERGQNKKPSKIGMLIGLKIWMLCFPYCSTIYIKHIADLRSPMHVV